MNLAQLTQKVLNLTQLFQQMLNLAKKIDELPEQTALDGASRIHVSKNGISQRLDVQKIIDSIANVSYNRLVAIGSLTIDGGALKIPALAQWVIENIFYQNSAIITIPIPFADTDKTRIDLIYANNQNQILRVAGIESAGLAVKPNLPANTIEVTTITVTDSVIGNPSNPEIGYAYILKNQYNEVGPDDGIFYLQQKANYIIIDEAITEIPGLSYMPEYQENLYSGKFILFTNKLLDPVRLINMDPAVDIPFNLNGEDVFLPPGGKVLFSWGSYGYNENGALEVVSYNFGGSSSDLNLDDVLSNGNETNQNAVFTNGTQYVTISSEGSIEIRDASPNGNKKIQLGSLLGSEIFKILSGDALGSDMFRIESGGNDNAGHSKIGNGQNLIEFLASVLEIRMHQKLKYVGSAATTFSGREIPDKNFIDTLLYSKVDKVGGFKTDINSDIDTGFYYVYETATGVPDNLPTGANILQHIQTEPIYSACQMIYSRTESIYTRVKRNGLWSDWTVLAKDTDVVHKTGEETVAGSKTFSGVMNVTGNYVKIGNPSIGISQFANEGGYMQWTGMTPGGVRRFLYESDPTIDNGADFSLYLNNGAGGNQLVQRWRLDKVSISKPLEVANIINLGKFTNGTEPALVSGAIYFNTTLNKMRIGGATAWETVTSS